MNHQRICALITALNLKIETLPPRTQKILGYYDWQSQTIWVNPNLTQRETTAVLTHELIHHLRGHQGPQSASVEKSVDEEASRFLITKEAYACAERVYGSDPRVLAEVLDTTVWVVEAFQRWLRRVVALR